MSSSLSFLHYSFDLWLTLIKSNPDFKKLRALYFHNQFNPHKKPLLEIEQIIRNVNVWANKTNELTGKNIDSDELYSLVLSQICDGDFLFSQTDLIEIINDINNLLFEHLPSIYSEDIVTTLSIIKSKENTSTSILSNTGFIPSSILNQVLDKLNLSQFFDFKLYSDEFNLSKPNTAFFTIMHNKVNQLRNTEINKSQIIHVGDNPVADIKGAEVYGINSFLVHSNQVSINQLLS